MSNPGRERIKPEIQAGGTNKNKKLDVKHNMLATTLKVRC